MLFEFNKKQIYIEKAIAGGLNKKIKSIEDNWDCVIICVGKEGVAKSSLMRQIGAYISHKQNLPFDVKNNIHFTVDDYIQACENSPKGTVHILDEARRDLLKSKSTSKSNVKFNNFMSECRNLNLFHIIILPQFSDLDKYLAKARTHILFSVGTKKNKETGLEERGYYKIIKLSKIKKLMKIYEDKYSKFPRGMTLLKGKFFKNEPLDINEYEKKKKEKRIEKFNDAKQKEESIILTPRQIEVLSKISAGANFKNRTKDYEILQKLVNSLKKTRLTENGL